jgi:hypothetical protein
MLALLDPDPDSEYGSGSGPTDLIESGSTALIESGSNTDPDSKALAAGQQDPAARVLAA